MTQAEVPVQVTRAAADTVRAVLEDVFLGDDYQWDVSRGLGEWIREAWWEFMTWLSGLETAHPGAYYGVVIGLAAILVLLLSHMVYLGVAVFRYRSSPARGAQAVHARGDSRNAEWYLREARRFEESGRYAESLACRFAALVWVLDRRRAVRAHPSKTPAEYAREAELGPGRKEILADTVSWLYECLFGGRRLDRSALDEFDRRAREVVA